MASCSRLLTRCRPPTDLPGPLGGRLYERVKGVWEERFERSYGFWRGLVDEVITPGWLDDVGGVGAATVCGRFVVR